MSKVPSDVKLAIETVPKVKDKWESLTEIGRRDFISWLHTAKQAETRSRRIEKMCDMLVKGKRRPCCYSVVPLAFHKVLEVNSKAKANWKGLSPNEKREFLDWIGEVSGKENTARIDKACKLLASGKRNLE